MSSTVKKMKLNKKNKKVLDSMEVKSLYFTTIAHCRLIIGARRSDLHPEQLIRLYVCYLLHALMHSLAHLLCSYVHPFKIRSFIPLVV